jgi:ATP-dependent RNA helicase DDX21
VVDFFVPAAERLLASEQPSRVLAAALAALAGFRDVPQVRPATALLACRAHV